MWSINLATSDHLVRGTSWREEGRLVSGRRLHVHVEGVSWTWFCEDREEVGSLVTGSRDKNSFIGTIGHVALRQITSRNRFDTKASKTSQLPNRLQTTALLSTDPISTTLTRGHGTRHHYSLRWNATSHGWIQGTHWHCSY
jgi:hypothetical protein